jgi:hypothetical protein
VHAEHPEPLRVTGRERAERHQRGGDRRPGEPGERGQLRRRAGGHDAAAGVEHRPPRRGERPRGELHLAPVRPRARVVAGQVGRARRAVARGTAGHVDRHVDEHRTRPPGGRQVQRVGDRLRRVVGALDRDRVLDDRRGDAEHVGLLERVRAAQGGADLAADEHGRHGVHVRVADRRDEVRRARAAGRERDAGPAGRPGIALGGVPGAGLVAHQHVPDAGVPQGVVERQARAAGHAEDGVDPGALERGDQGVGAAHRYLR